jgi:hypothetical protein
LCCSTLITTQQRKYCLCWLVHSHRPYHIISYIIFIPYQHQHYITILIVVFYQVIFQYLHPFFTFTKTRHSLSNKFKFKFKILSLSSYILFLSLSSSLTWINHFHHKFHLHSATSSPSAFRTLQHQLTRIIITTSLYWVWCCLFVLCCVVLCLLCSFTIAPIYLFDLILSYLISSISTSSSSSLSSLYQP